MVISPGTGGSGGGGTAYDTIWRFWYNCESRITLGVLVHHQVIIHGGGGGGASEATGNTPPSNENGGAGGDGLWLCP